MPRFEKLTGAFEIKTGDAVNPVTWRFARTVEIEREFTLAEASGPLPSGPRLGRSGPQSPPSPFLSPPLPLMLQSLIGWKGVLDAEGRPIEYSEAAFHEYIPSAMRLALLRRWTQRMRGEARDTGEADRAPAPLPAEALAPDEEAALAPRDELAPPEGTDIETQPYRVSVSVPDAIAVPRVPAEHPPLAARLPSPPGIAPAHPATTPARPTPAPRSIDPGGAGPAGDPMAAIPEAAHDPRGSDLAESPTAAPPTGGTDVAPRPDPSGSEGPLLTDEPGATDSPPAPPAPRLTHVSFPLAEGAIEPGSLIDDPDLDLDPRFADAVGQVYRRLRRAETHEPLF